MFRTFSTFGKSKVGLHPLLAGIWDPINHFTICILANTDNDKIKVWKSYVEDKFVLSDESVLDTMEHDEKLCDMSKQNDREKVLKNTYAPSLIMNKF